MESQRIEIVFNAMKNQYFGDINDYKKYGLLRNILSVSNINILIAWMLTEDDGSSDGKFIEYFKKPEKWEKYDKPLYVELSRILQQKEKREVKLIESSSLLKNTEYSSQLVPDDAKGRKCWFSVLLEKSKKSDLVFLDPDNGLEIKSKKYGTKDSSKFLYWHEVAEFWKCGKSVLIYQHFRREKREAFIERMLISLNKITEESLVGAFSTSNVVFLLALCPEHHHLFEPIVNVVEKSWSGQIKFSNKKCILEDDFNESKRTIDGKSCKPKTLSDRPRKP